MWTDLSQEEKFDIMRDYVRRGFHNLDDIMNDYDNRIETSKNASYQKHDTSIHNQDIKNYTDVLREFYSDGDFEAY